MNPLDKWLTLDELASYLTLSRTKLYGMTHKGIILCGEAGHRRKEIEGARHTNGGWMSEQDESKGQFLIYQTEAGKFKLDVRLEEETVWLSQRLMSEFFQKDVRTIREHVQNVYDEVELDPQVTIQKFRIVQNEGSRQVSRLAYFYNLYMIISVGHRFKSHIALDSTSGQPNSSRSWFRS